MNKRTVLGVALRVVGVWSLIHALDRGLFYVVYYASMPWDRRSVSGSPVSWMVAAVSFSVFLVPLGLVLLRYADAIARKLVLRRAVTVEDAVVPVQRRVFVLALRVIGVYYALQVVPSVLQSLAAGVWPWRSEQGGYSWPYLAVGLIVFVAACYLFFDGSGIVRLAFRPKTEESPR